MFREEAFFLSLSFFSSILLFLLLFLLSLFFPFFRKDLTAVEIAFIRGGNTNYIPSTRQLENTSINDQEEADLEENESPQLSSRSSLDHNAEVNGYLNDMSRAPNDIGTTLHRTSPRLHQMLSQNGHHQNGASLPMPSYPFHTFPQPGISSTHFQPQQNGYHTSNGVNVQLRHGFNPTMSSTPNDIPINGQQLPTTYGQMNGKLLAFAGKCSNVN